MAASKAMPSGLPSTGALQCPVLNPTIYKLTKAAFRDDQIMNNIDNNDKKIVDFHELCSDTESHSQSGKAQPVKHVSSKITCRSLAYVWLIPLQYFAKPLISALVREAREKNLRRR